MKLELYSVGTSQKRGNVTHAGVGIVLIATDEHGRSLRRDLGFYIGSAQDDIIELKAARFALSCVLPQHRKYHTTLHVISSQVPMALSNNNNSNEAKEFAKWFSFYGDLTIKLELPQNQYVEFAKELANKVAISGAHSDSKSYTV